MQFYIKLQIFAKIVLPIISVLWTITGCDINRNSLEGKTICLDPGHGGSAATDSFRVGPSGEREEWINLRVALELKTLLEKTGCTVILTRIEDVSISLKDRARIAVDKQADVFISIHHNATADTTVNFPIVYFHGNASENQASVHLGRCVIKHLLKVIFKNKTNQSLVSDHTIFPTSGTAVLRHSYGIPGIIGEASFFSNPAEEERLKSNNYNCFEAQAYFKALEEYFSTTTLPIKQKSPQNQIPPFLVLQESDRMDPVARLWQQDYNQAVTLYKFEHPDSVKKSFGLFTRSVGSFPDSWLAGSAHSYRARILDMQKKYDEADMEKRRISEYYINLK
jgi:N-acetylmuramoyl-L-alanine amidase